MWRLRTLGTDKNINSLLNMDNIKLTTFNCKHFRTTGPKMEFISGLMTDCNFLMLQEHCLHYEHLYKLKAVGTNVEVVGKSSMDGSVPLLGRPYGGCAIIYKTNIDYNVNEIKCENNRLCGVHITVGQSDIVILNVYMPCDATGNFYVYESILNEVAEISYKYSNSRLILCGDINTDLGRASLHTRTLTQFLDDNSMISCIDIPGADVPYTFIGPYSTSRIDNFLVSKDIVNDICECRIVDDHNFSDHVPVQLVLNISYDCIAIKSRKFVSKLKWDCASNSQIDNYKQSVCDGLQNMDIDYSLIMCNDSQCKNHTNDICNFYNGIISVCLNAAQDNIPCTTCNPDTEASGNKNIAGWNEHVKSLHKESLWWHKYWKQSGCPRDGHTAEMHRITRARYHHAIRCVLRDQDKIVITRMAEAIGSNCTRDLWKEVRKIKGRNNQCSNVVDQCSSDSDIANIFYNKYNDLYNSVPYDCNVMTNILHEVNSRICQDSLITHTIMVEDVTAAVNKLKHGKTDGMEGMCSDHIINGPQVLLVYLSFILNCMLTHGISPDSVICGTMVPIPKGKFKQLTVSDNYRAITLSSIIGKIFDLIVMDKEKHNLYTSDLQFGFKDHVSTTMCTFAMNEVISYYRHKNSNVYVLMLDATKAFDRVDYGKLFQKLLDRNICPLVLRLLIFMYTNQKLCVRWNGHYSDKFGVLNGVKQGGVLSPVLFSIYMDELCNKLGSSNVGCRVGNHFAGCLAYADDLTLLAPTRKALQVMVNVCESYAAEHSVIFNGSKSQFLVFKGTRCNSNKCSIIVNNEVLDNIDNAVHLGHNISTVNTDSMLTNVKSKFWKSFNMFMADFGHISSDLKCKLFKQYCCSFYGSQLMSLDEYRLLEKEWRKALRKLWGLPYRAHNYIVTLLSDTVPLYFNLLSRFWKFVQTVSKSGPRFIQAIACRSVLNPFSLYGQNIVEIRSVYANLDLYSTQFKSYVYNEWSFNDVNDDMRITSSMVHELVRARDGFYVIDNFNKEDIDVLLECICIN